MKNVKYAIKGQKLLVEVDLSSWFEGTADKSASGKSFLIASTEGNIRIPVEGSSIYLGLNVFSYDQKPQPVKPKAQKVDREEKGSKRAQAIDLTEVNKRKKSGAVTTKNLEELIQEQILKVLIDLGVNV